MERLLVAIDGSESAERALTYALEEFRDPDVRAVFVMENLANYAAEGDVPNPEERAQQEAESLFERAEAIAAEHGREIETDTIVGHPAKSLVEYAEEEDFDHIVVGSTGKTGVKRVLLGSVAETVVRRSDRPVTVVR